jgi:hypothetical protein
VKTRQPKTTAHSTMSNMNRTIPKDESVETFADDVNITNDKWGAVFVRITETEEETILRWANGSKELLTIPI